MNAVILLPATNLPNNDAFYETPWAPSQCFKDKIMKEKNSTALDIQGQVLNGNNIGSRKRRKSDLVCRMR